MIAKKIRLTDFRNIENAEVSFSDGVNLIFGDNAGGKTNLLEAVYYAAIGKSFRGQHAQEIIRFGCKDAFFSFDYEGEGRTQNISVRIFSDRERKAEKNRVRISRMSELIGSFRAVLFCPEHLSLIKNGPSERRQFLDIAISSENPLYLASLQRYARILRQRNALIRNAAHDSAFEETADIWSEQLATEAAFLARERMRYIKRADVCVRECFCTMSGEKEKPVLGYLGPFGHETRDYEDLEETKKFCYEKLTQNKQKELQAGATLYGIHKDDLDVTLNGKPARLYASQGQQRSLALALKIAEGELCRKNCGEYPVFLFDDVLSELDPGRRSFLLNKIKDKQVILTTCERFTQGEEISSHRIFVENGTYREIRS